MTALLDERERLLEMINGAWMCQAIAAACEFGVADRLSRGPATAATLADELGLSRDAAGRLLRALAALGIAVERDGEASLTAAGRLLVSGSEGSVRDWALMNASRGWAAWGQLRAGLRSGRNVRREADVPAFAELGGEDAERFNRAMIDLTRPVASALAASDLLEGHETLVDVGGGAGHLVLPLLARHPRMKAIVFDLPHARGVAERAFREAGFESRCRFEGGSFFERVPEGGHVYILKSVLHNWPDDRALDILLRCRAAMADGARLVLVERILRESASDSATDREHARSDLQMMLACDGRERTDAQFTRLLGSAGLRRTGARALTPLMHAIVAVAG